MGSRLLAKVNNNTVSQAGATTTIFRAIREQDSSTQHLRGRVLTSTRLVLETKAQILEVLELQILIVNFMDHLVDLGPFIQDQDLLVSGRVHKQRADH